MSTFWELLQALRIAYKAPPYGCIFNTSINELLKFAGTFKFASKPRNPANSVFPIPANCQSSDLFQISFQVFLDSAVAQEVEITQRRKPEALRSDPARWLDFSIGIRMLSRSAILLPLDRPIERHNPGGWHFKSMV